jgi:Xaa-Pro aminopeptidase
LTVSSVSPTGTSAEAQAKCRAALEAVGRPFATAFPATVRWLLCGRGRPVSSSAPAASYTVWIDEDGARVLHQDIESSRVQADERFEELGYDIQAYPWFEPKPLPHGLPSEDEIEKAVAPLRRRLSEDERERFRRVGADAAAAVQDVVVSLRPEENEYEVAGALAAALRTRGFFPPVVLVASGERQLVHRHPLPIGEQLGRHALLAVTAEREGLHASLTRIASFGSVPEELARLNRLGAEVDAAMLNASRPGTTVEQVLNVAADAYAERGFPEEWRKHHQGGITGYKGRETFAVPGDQTQLPDSGAVAWNPSITGGAKSEDTALVTEDGVEVITRTPELPTVEVGGLSRAAIVEL